MHGPLARVAAVPLGALGDRTWSGALRHIVKLHFGYKFRRTVVMFKLVMHPIVDVLATR